MYYSRLISIWRLRVPEPTYPVTMSGALVAGGPSGSNFAQQGSVHWVSLSSSTLSISLEAM